MGLELIAASLLTAGTSAAVGNYQANKSKKRQQAALAEQQALDQQTAERESVIAQEAGRASEETSNVTVGDQRRRKPNMSPLTGNMIRTATGGVSRVGS